MKSDHANYVRPEEQAREGSEPVVFFHIFCSFVCSLQVLLYCGCKVDRFVPVKWPVERVGIFRFVQFCPLVPTVVRCFLPALLTARERNVGFDVS